MFGNALGNAAIAGIEAENAHNATKPAQAAIEINPGSPQLEVSDINMPLAAIGPVPYTVQSGDSLSGILGTSDPAAIGAFMRANGLTSSTIYPGEQLVFPSGGYTDSDAALGQATLNVDNQRIAALQARQSYGTGIQWMSAGEQEEMLNAFPDATHGTSSGLANNDDVVGDYINMMNQVGSYEQAIISGGYAGFQAIPGKMDAAVASVWGDIKSGWAHVSSLNALAGDVLSLNNEISQLPEQLPRLPGEVQNWATGLGIRVEQDGAQLLDYLRNTPGTQIAYDAAYTLTSNAPMIAFAVGTDGLGEVTDSAGAIEITADSSVTLARQRQYQMLLDDVGYNVSPLSWNQFATIGVRDTFATDRAGIMNYFGDLAGQNELAVTSAQATEIEKGLGLTPGSLQDGFSVRQITGITEMDPASPLTGNLFFRGAGMHLPNGAPELTIRPIPTMDNQNVTTILTVHVRP